MTPPSHLIMVIEDDEDIREALCELLEYEGYLVVSRRNGSEALEYLRSGQAPCLILLDLMMPVMDGWTFRKEQQRDPSLTKIPVVVLTAGGKELAEGIDANLVLCKPLPLEKILRAVSAYC